MNWTQGWKADSSAVFMLVPVLLLFLAGLLVDYIICLTNIPLAIYALIFEGIAYYIMGFWLHRYAPPYAWWLMLFVVFIIVVLDICFNEWLGRLTGNEWIPFFGLLYMYLLEKGIEHEYGK